MGASPVYRHPLIYSTIMRVLYGRHYDDRYSAVADLIDSKSSVLELCSGDCRLYLRYLKDKDVMYKGLEFNPTFVKYAHSEGVSVKQADIRECEFPQADIILMQASLYQFMPNHKDIVDKMIGAAGKAVIIAEPIKNLASTNIPILSSVMRKMADPGTGHAPKRFTAETFADFWSQNYGSMTYDITEIPGGREAIVKVNC